MDSSNMCRYVVKVSTETSVSYFSLSSLLSVQDFLENNLVIGTNIEISKL